MVQQGSRNDIPAIKEGHGFLNRLGGEKSPYLSQHAANPVDWYPWGEEAFRRAAEEDKPVFLSIGYATCHWCHVMAHESFEDKEVAGLLNGAFVCIKVDREERPDIDQVYMAACQMMTGSCGWPLTIFLTPDKKPFFAATYIPRESRFGITGMLDILPRIAKLWNERKKDLLASSEQFSAALEGFASQMTADAGPGSDLLTTAYEELVLGFDPEYGGFGSAPKFPSPHTLMFLLRYWKRTGTRRALDMVTKTLDEIRMGGIYDQLGGGIHRYSTDRKWRIPHFEKMLYDQALIAIAYIEAFQVTGKPGYRKTAEEILGYVLRDMVSSQGAFCSAQDADSNGREGGYYLWDADEILSILGSEDEMIARIVFNTPKTGIVTDPPGEGAGNVLYLTAPEKVLAGRLCLPEDVVAGRIEKIKQTLFAARLKRPRPFLDDKVLADWNGLMIAALAKAAQAFDNPAFAQSAARAAGFILSEMRMPDGGLFHRYHTGEAAVLGFADDYAALVYGLTELYEVTFDEQYLASALDLTSYLLAHFQDPVQGSFFTIPDNGERLIVRTKELYDGAVPSCNSMILYDLLRLSRLAGREEFEKVAATLSANFSKAAATTPPSYTFYLCALEYVTGNPTEVVVAGERNGTDTKMLIRACRTGFFPSLVVRVREMDAKEQPAPLQDLPADSYPVLNGQATAYVCSRQACLSPVTDPEKLQELLDQRLGSRSGVM